MLLPLATPITVPVVRRPLSLPSDNGLRQHFDARARAMLQLLPSGICLPVAVKKPLILGRADGGSTDDILDLTEFNAIKHGVSRHHALLHRSEHHLLVTDLGSTNGTHLNGSLILPHEDHILSQGDKLILGTLHLLISFTDVEPESRYDAR